MNTKLEYVLFETDESFDYNGPFGTATQYEKSQHGFYLEFDDNDNVILSSLKGFGLLEEIEKDISTLEELKDTILEYWSDELYLDDDKHISRLLKMINSQLKKYRLNS